MLTNIYTTYILFFSDKNQESHRIYSFTKKQIKQYLNEIDKIFVINDLPKPSEYKDHFIFLRLIWATVRMQRWPKTQMRRYELYEKTLNEYLEGNNIEDMLISH